MTTESSFITPDFVRTFIRDTVEYNKLLDDIQFTDERIVQARQLSISMFNLMTPISNYELSTFPNQTLLLLGALHFLFLGEAAAAARNELTYQDGGLTVTLEERYQYYMQLAGSFKESFSSAAQAYKIQLNLESGYGEVRSDYAYLPTW